LGSTDIHGLEALRKIAVLLHGEVPQPPAGLELMRLGSQIPFSLRRGLSITDEADGSLTVEMHLPGANREDLSLRAEGHFLHIGVHGREREIELSRDVDVTGARAKFRDDILRLTIQPQSTEEE
jgi:hypothetical protein